MTDDRLAALEARVAALEGAPTPGADERADESGAEVPPSGEAAAGGGVGYFGEVELHGRVSWRIDYAAASVVTLPTERAAAVLAALGHPARLSVVQHLLRGPCTTAELAEVFDGGSKGQLYHHLNALAAAGIVEKQARGTFAVAAPTVVPLLVAMLAAADIGGTLR